MGPNQKWGADISYVWTREGWLYLAVVIDLFARRVDGWSTSDRLHKELALSALRRAIAVRRPPAGLIHHADRGSQYCSLDYQAELRRHGIRISMSGKGNCFDNAMVETFFKTVKSELVWRAIFQSRVEAKVLGLKGDEVHEGAHCSPSRFIFNNVNFPANDPLVDILAAANYEVRPNPVDPHWQARASAGRLPGRALL